MVNANEQNATESLVLMIWLKTINIDGSLASGFTPVDEIVSICR